MVLDADGLWLVSQNPSLVQGYTNAILTPNIAEFQRLWDAKGLDETVMPTKDMVHHIRSSLWNVYGDADPYSKEVPAISDELFKYVDKELDNPVLQVFRPDLSTKIGPCSDAESCFFMSST